MKKAIVLCLGILLILSLKTRVDSRNSTPLRANVSGSPSELPFVSIRNDATDAEGSSLIRIGNRVEAINDRRELVLKLSKKVLKNDREREELKEALSDEAELRAALAVLN